MTLRDRVLDAFLTRAGLTPELLFDTRTPGRAGFRATAMYLFHDVCDDTFEEIAERFPGETAASVMLHVKQIEMERSSDENREWSLQQYYDLIESPYGKRKKTDDNEPFPQV